MCLNLEAEAEAVDEWEELWLVRSERGFLVRFKDLLVLLPSILIVIVIN